MSDVDRASDPKPVPQPEPNEDKFTQAQKSKTTYFKRENVLKTEQTKILDNESDYYEMRARANSDEIKPKDFLFDEQSLHE